MLRCTIELIPAGNEEAKRTIGLVEIANVGGTREVGNYLVTATKTPPFRGALKDLWRKANLVIKEIPNENEKCIAGYVPGFHRLKQGSYDLLYLALRELVGDRHR